MFSDQIDEINMALDKPNHYPHPIVYRTLMRPEKQNTPIPSRASLLEEAVALVIAGTDTTGSTLTIGTYQVLRKPEIYANLKAELLEAWPNLEQRPNAGDLEKLPYLVGHLRTLK
jgi:cytochrome P450